MTRATAGPASPFVAEQSRGRGQAARLLFAESDRELGVPVALKGVAHASPELLAGGVREQSREAAATTSPT